MNKTIEIYKTESRWDSATSELKQSVKGFANVEGQLANQIMVLAKAKDFSRTALIMSSTSSQLSGLLIIMQNQIDVWIDLDKQLLKCIANENNQILKKRYQSAHKVINDSSAAAIQGTTQH